MSKINRYAKQNNHNKNIKHSKYTPPVKMTRQEAITLWDNMSPQLQHQFKEMLNNLRDGKLMIKEVNVNDKEEIKNIVLEHKDKPSKPTEPFAKFFPQEK